MFRAVGHVGVWVGLYALGAFMFIAQVSGSGPGVLPRWEALAAVFLTVTAVYALDRAKLRDAWLDPADLAAQPERFEFIRIHSWAIRVLALAMLLAAAVVGARLSAWAPAVVAMSAAGVVAYAGKPRTDRSRIKDVLGLKNAYVAVGMTMFVLAVTLASSGERVPLRWNPRIPALLIVSVILGIRIVLDAAMCDIDDAPTDSQFGTATWATTLGKERLWVWAGLLRVVLVAALLLAVPLPWRARASWAGAMTIGTVALRWPRWPRLRDPVDLRFVSEAIIATGALLAWQRLA